MHTFTKKLLFTHGLMVLLLSLSCGEDQSKEYTDPTLPTRNPELVGDSFSLNQDAELNNKVEFRLELFGTWGPIPGKASIPSCRQPLPNNFSLGTLICKNTGREIDLQAKNVNQICSQDTKADRALASTSAFTSECAEWELRLHSFQPGLCIQAIGKTIYSSKACLIQNRT